MMVGRREHGIMAPAMAEALAKRETELLQAARAPENKLRAAIWGAAIGMFNPTTEMISETAAELAAKHGVPVESVRAALVKQIEER